MCSKFPKVAVRSKIACMKMSEGIAAIVVRALSISASLRKIQLVIFKISKRECQSPERGEIYREREINRDRARPRERCKERERERERERETERGRGERQRERERERERERDAETERKEAQQIGQKACLNSLVIYCTM